MGELGSSFSAWLRCFILGRKGKVIVGLSLVWFVIMLALGYSELSPTRYPLLVPASMVVVYTLFIWYLYRKGTKKVEEKEEEDKRLESS